jgi:molybdopterin/thiamine biosynthesis adenylyltransferase
MFYHEQLYRGDDLLQALRTFPITVCGAGAVGANLSESLIRSGCGHLRVIDCDRVEERNLSTQPYGRDDIGARKATALAYRLYRAIGADVEEVPKRLTQTNARKLLTDSHLVVDAFDNSASRRAVTEACAEADIPCLHVGLADGYAEVLWNERYRVPSDAQDDRCDYPLARSLVLLAVAVATETIIGFIATGERPGYTMTLKDWQVVPYG